MICHYWRSSSGPTDALIAEEDRSDFFGAGDITGMVLFGPIWLVLGGDRLGTALSPHLDELQASPFRNLLEAVSG